MIKAAESKVVRLGYLAALSGECYFKQISKESYIFIQKIEGKWIVYIARYSDERDRGKITSEKVIINDFKLFEKQLSF